MTRYEKLFNSPHTYAAICDDGRGDPAWDFLREVMQEELGVSPKRVARDRVASLFQRVVDRLEEGWEKGREELKTPAIVLSRLIQLRLRE